MASPKLTHFLLVHTRVFLMSSSWSWSCHRHGLGSIQHGTVSAFFLWLGKTTNTKKSPKQGSSCNIQVERTPHHKEAVCSNPARCRAFSLFSIMSVACPKSGPMWMCNLTDFPIKCSRLCSLRWSKPNSNGLSKNQKNEPVFNKHLLVLFWVEDKDDSVGLPPDGRPTAPEVGVAARVPELDVRLHVAPVHVHVLETGNGSG